MKILVVVVESTSMKQIYLVCSTVMNTTVVQYLLNADSLPKLIRDSGHGTSLVLAGNSENEITTSPKKILSLVVS